MKTKITFCVIFLCFALHSSRIQAQIFQQWVARFDGANDSIDMASSMTIDKKENVYVCGYSNENDTSQVAVIIKYDKKGNEQWVRKYAGSLNLNAGAAEVKVDDKGNVYMGGAAFETNNNTSFVTIKYDSDGNQKWVGLYSGVGSSNNQIRGLEVDAEGNVYVTGWSDTLGPNFGGIVTIKYDSNGIQKWLVRYSNTNNGSDEAESMILGDSGNVYVIGTSWSSMLGSNYGLIILKYNTNGVEQWRQFYELHNGGGSNGKIILDKNDNIYISAITYENITTNADFVVMKYDKDGNMQWKNVYNGLGNGIDVPVGLDLDALGNVYVTGFTTAIGGDYDFITFKYDNDGNQQWERTFSSNEGDNFDYTQGIVVDLVGNVYVTGTITTNTSRWDYVTIKYDTDGNQQWLIKYDGPAKSWDYTRAIAIDEVGNIYVTGNSYGTNKSNNYDITTIKYSTNPNRIIENIFSKNEPSISPNPFTHSTTIEIKSEIVNGKSEILIYDVLGQAVHHQALSTKHETLNLNLPSGIYFYKVKNEKEAIANGKLVVR